MLEIKKLVEQLIDSANKIKEIVDSLEKEPTNNEKTIISFPELRQKLANYSRQGYTEIIKTAINKINAEKLSDVKTENYNQLLADIEGAINGSK